MSQVNATTLTAPTPPWISSWIISLRGTRHAAEPAVRGVKATLMVVSGIKIQLGGVIALVALFFGTGSLPNFE